MNQGGWDPGCLGQKTPYLEFKTTGLLHRGEWGRVGGKDTTVSTLLGTPSRWSSVFILLDGWERRRVKAQCCRAVVTALPGSCLCRLCSHLQCVVWQGQLFPLSTGGRESEFSEIRKALTILSLCAFLGAHIKKSTSLLGQ